MNVQVTQTPAAVAANLTSVPVLVIGCGFGGIATAIALEKAGFRDFTILERAHDVGGVWRDNSYPGAACDVVSRFYSFSFEQGYPWSDAFGPRAEIFDYIHRVVDKYGVRRHVRFDAEVASAAFDEARALWGVETARGERFETPVLISAVGLFNRPFVPPFPGRESFAGVQFHSARWDHSFDLAGKTVAVVGNGASCTQFLPKIAPKVKHLHLFQRSPQYVMPKRIFPGTSDLDLWLGRRPWLRWIARTRIFFEFENNLLRRRRKPALRTQGEARFRALLAAKVKDPALRAKLTPDYPMGCKRQLVSNDWYDALIRPNVEVVTESIAKIQPEGIETADGTLRKVDAIVWGTGFTPTDYLQPMRITGRQGRDLNEAWRHGAEAHLGITVSGFPNFFMLYGPNTNAQTSIIYMLECQARYIVRALKLLRRRGARFMDVRADVQRTFNDRQQAILSESVAAQANCQTYFKNAEGRITTNWAGYASEYRWKTRAVRPDEFEFG
jgi:cation diffusion facilitator CzcD-associated flavoprotein CzcO